MDGRTLKISEQDTASGACYKAKGGGKFPRPYFFDGKNWIVAGSEAKARAEHAARVSKCLHLASLPGADPRYSVACDYVCPTPALASPPWLLLS